MIEDTDNSLLGFLQARPKAVGEAFRTNPRHDARRRARLSWERGSHSCVVAARLIDISRAGAAISVSDPPALSTVVRLRLVGSTPTPWIEAQVLGVDPIEGGGSRVRLLFRDPCPTVFLKSAVLGAIPPSAEVVSPEAEEAI